MQILKRLGEIYIWAKFVDFGVCWGWILIEIVDYGFYLSDYRLMEKEQQRQ